MAAGGSYDVKHDLCVSLGASWNTGRQRTAAPPRDPGSINLHTMSCALVM